jgi:hypothetical protein
MEYGNMAINMQPLQEVLLLLLFKLQMGFYPVAVVLQ